MTDDVEQMLDEELVEWLRRLEQLPRLNFNVRRALREAAGRIERTCVYWTANLPDDKHD